MAGTVGSAGDSKLTKQIERSGLSHFLQTVVNRRKPVKKEKVGESFVDTEECTF